MSSFTQGPHSTKLSVSTAVIFITLAEEIVCFSGEWATNGLRLYEIYILLLTQITDGLMLFDELLVVGNMNISNLQNTVLVIISNDDKTLSYVINRNYSL